MAEDLNGIDSRYRFVIIASRRGKQLLKGAKPKIETHSKNLIRIAQEEVAKGVIKYEILPPEPEIEKEETVEEEEKKAEE